MVNHGRSGRCNTCRERRVKCDEGKPSCQRCLNLGRQCGGYRKGPIKLRIKDESHKFTDASIRQKETASHISELDPRQSQVELQLPRSLSQRDTAVEFFLTYSVSLGRSLESTRGFFELIVPVLAAEPQDSPLSVVISGVAERFLSLWLDGPSGFLSPQASLVQALECLRTATEHPVERSKPSTIIAALLFNFYENVAGVYRVQKVLRYHYDGAMSLLPFTDSEPSQPDITLRSYIARFLLHAEVSFALREGRRLSNHTLSLLGIRHLNVTPNPSSTLDELGANIAELRSRYTSLSTQTNIPSSFPSSEQRLKDLRREARLVEADLLAWAQSVPTHWRPLRLRSGQDFDVSIVAYEGVAEIYPSCQIASIWNAWRCYYLLLAQMFLAFPKHAISDCEHPSDDLVDAVSYQNVLRGLVNSVCYSVPFFLGNRTGASNIDDLTNPKIYLPSYHSLPRADSRRCSMDHGIIMSADEHQRHVVAQGAWHSMGPLSHLLTMFSDDYGWVMTSALAPGQQEWIREQFLRVATLLRLPVDEEFSDEEKVDLRLVDSGSRADRIACRLREGMSLIGGI